MIEWMMNFIQNVGQWLISILPTSPFRPWIDQLQMPEYMGWLNWFFPVHQIVLVLTAWLSAIALFYAYSVIMRWIKLIGS